MHPFIVYTVSCLWCIAVAAPDIASLEPDEDMPLPDQRAFSLNGGKNFFYTGIYHIRNNTEQ
jgi:hypothetical protein